VVGGEGKPGEEGIVNKRGQILFFLPALVVFIVFVLIPSTQTLMDSFYSHQGMKRQFVGALYYRYAVTDPKFHQSLANNAGYLLWTLLFEVVVGLALAVGLEKNNRFNNFLRVAFFSPSVLSMVVVGLVFGFLFKDGVGVLPGLLNESRALLTISVISGWASAGFFMIIFLAGLANIPDDVLEAARLDGASDWQTFWRIKLPLLKEVIYVALLICFTGAFKAFDLFWVLLPNQDHTSIVSTLLVKEVIKFDNKGYGSTLAVILTALVLVTTAIIVSAKKLWGRRGGGRFDNTREGGHGRSHARFDWREMLRHFLRRSACRPGGVFHAGIDGGKHAVDLVAAQARRSEAGRNWKGH
jgi:raffinose/stachyose/melibiose transport system permease protein